MTNTSFCFQLITLIQYIAHLIIVYLKYLNNHMIYQYDLKDGSQFKN